MLTDPLELKGKVVWVDHHQYRVKAVEHFATYFYENEKGDYMKEFGLLVDKEEAMTDKTRRPVQPDTDGDDQTTPAPENR